MRNISILRHSLFLSLLCFAAFAGAAEDDHYRVDWHVALAAGEDLAKVALEIEDGRPVRSLRLRFDPARFSDFEATGELTVTDGEATWVPPRKDAKLTYAVKITRERDNKNQEKSYDALMTDDWALFRGDRITPRIAGLTRRKGAVADTLLHFELPEGWNANTGYWRYDGAADGEIIYEIDDPERNFERPTGWILVGDVGSRRADVGENTYFSIVAPRNSGADRMTWLTLVSLVYPEFEKAFVKVPSKIMMVSGDDPLWRGGLSGPNSFYFHSSRRAVSENGTSPLLHELTHVITRISGQENDDWIAEGIAEYYGIELSRRAGGMTRDRMNAILDNLADWGKEASKLRVRASTGPVTARAVGVFAALDKEIGELTSGKENLDAVTRLLMEKRRVSLDDLREAFEEVTGKSSATLKDLE